MRLLSLSTDEGQIRLHAERVIANARAALSAGGFIAVYLDSSEPAHFATVAYSLLIAYVGVSVVIAAHLRTKTTLARHAGRALSALDLAIAAVLTSFTEGAASPLFVFVWFALIAAAFRSGLRGTFAAAGFMAAVLVVQSVFLREFYQTVSLNLIIVRTTLLAVMAFLLGYLSEKERDLRTEAVAVARVLGRSRNERTFSAALEAAVDEIAKVYASPRAVIAIADEDGERYCWIFRRSPAGVLTGELTPVTPREDAAYFFDVPPDVQSWYCRRDPTSGVVVDWTAVTRDGRGTRTRIEPPPAFWEALGTSRALGSVEPLASSRVHLLLSAASLPHHPQLSVHLLHAISQQVGPPLVNLYLQRAQAGASERARLARELHDRVVQSLIGLEMQMVALERQRGGDTFGASLETMRQTLRAEIDNVRDLMQELRPVRVSPEDLSMFLADLVERFQRQTGIRASFASDVSSIDATPRQCAALVRIVQEALVNVRKHSGAKSVAVGLTQDDGPLRVTIADDGQGFPFGGRLNDEQLWAEHKGPLVIKERARSIGALLVVDSAPGRGATLELEIPDAT